MHRPTVVADGIERTYRTEMDGRELNNKMDNVNNGYEQALRFMDDKGATVCVNPSRCAVVRFEGWDDRR